MYSVDTIRLICEAFDRNEEANGKYTICTASIELTRRCNLACYHCMKGDAEDLDIDARYIDAFMSQVGLIYCLALSGGEVTLCPDLIRYTFESARRHKVRIKRLIVTTNGIYKNPEFLKVFEEFSDYTEIPELNRILISNDRFHTAVSGLTEEDYQDRKKFFENGGKNIVEFQDCCNWKIFNLKRSGKIEKFPEYDKNWDRYRNKVMAYKMADEFPKLKKQIRGYGKHLCKLELTATGHILPDDIISYTDEDTDTYYNGTILDTIPQIIKNNISDPHYIIGKFMNMIVDLDSLKDRLKRDIGFTGMGLFFMSQKKRESLKSVCSAFCEILSEIYNDLPNVKDYLNSPECPENVRKFINVESLENVKSEYEKLKGLIEKI